MRAFNSEFLNCRENICGDCPSCKNIVHLNDKECLHCGHILTDNEKSEILLRERRNFRIASILGAMATIFFISAIVAFNSFVKL